MKNVKVEDDLFEEIAEERKRTGILSYKLMRLAWEAYKEMHAESLGPPKTLGDNYEQQ